jgi:hypothetical protein
MMNIVNLPGKEKWQFVQTFKIADTQTGYEYQSLLETVESLIEKENGLVFSFFINLKIRR